MRIAVPCDDGRMCEHFGHAPTFQMFDVDPQSRKIGGQVTVAAPPHQPGLLPGWLAEQGARVVLTGLLGQRAKMLFAQQGIEVVSGVQEPLPQKAVEGYLDGSLVNRDVTCGNGDHSCGGH